MNTRSPLRRDFWSVYVNDQTLHGLYTENDAIAIGKQLNQEGGGKL